MKIKHKILFLLLANVAVLVAIGVFYRYSYLKQQNDFFAKLMRKNNEMIENVVKSKRDHFSSFINDYAQWDELVAFSENQDQKWAEKNINTTIENLKIDFCSIYGADKKMIYSVTDSNTLKPDNLPINESLFKDCFQNGKTTCHFFVKQNKTIFEIFGVTIVASSDTKRNSGAKGYFIIGLAWDEPFLKLFENSLGYKTLLSDDESGKIEHHDSNLISNNKIVFKRDLYSVNDKVIASLIFEQKQQYSEIVKTSNLEFYLLSIIGIITIVVFYSLIKFWVSDPFSDTSLALEKNDMSYIKKFLSRKDEFGGIAGLISRFYAQKEEIAKSEKSFRDLIEYLPDYILVHDKGIITYVNHSIIEASGYLREDLIGKSVLKIVAEYHREQAKEQLRMRVLGAEVNDYEIDLLTKQGEIRHVMIKGRTLEYFDNGANLLVIVDLTNFKKVEDYKAKMQVAEESAKTKQLFLSTMSHEMRTPMNGIMGMTHFLLETELNPTQEDFAKNIKNSSENLLNIIDNILELSKIEAGQVRIYRSKVSLKSMVKQLDGMYDSFKCSDNIHFSVNYPADIPQVVEIDDKRIMQILTNLVSNAVKYTQKGEIRVNISYAKNQDASIKLLFEVSDTGIGIEKNHVPMLFKRFSQVESSSTRSFCGVGIGLSICKELALLMDGEVGVHSEKGVGSTFWLSVDAFCFEDTEKVLVDEQHSEVQNLSLRILVVEDNLINYKVVAKMLEKMGCTITLATNGVEALEVFEDDKFDIVLMDIQMPVMDGLTAMKELRANYTNLPPIIALTADAMAGDAEFYINHGMDDYMAKPVKKDYLYQVLSKWVKKDEA